MSNIDINSVDSKHLEAEELIEKFKKTFVMRFGIEPIVKYNMECSFFGKFNLHELLKITDKALNEHMYYDGYYDTIMTKTRKRPVVYFRQAFCKIASDMRYPCMQIAKMLGINHATVIHSVKTVNNLIDTKDKDMIHVMSLVNKTIDEHLKQNNNGRILQESSGVLSQS
jgi:hypothetical protein